MTRSVGLLVLMAGVLTAGWGPIVFELVSGSRLPAPVATDAAAMAVWSGVAFARVFGALLACVGALLVAATATNRGRATAVVLFWGGLLAVAITVSQQVAIWTSDVGYVFVALLLGLVTAAGAELTRTRAPEVESSA